MIYERYSARTLEKLKSALGKYAGYVYTDIGGVGAVQRLTTTEHFRTPPAGEWEPCPEGAFEWGGELVNLWLRCEVTVPPSASGQKLYVMAKTGAVEVLMFRDGKPAGIFNHKGVDCIGGLHEVRLVTADACPGDSYELAFECYAGHYCAGTQPFDNYGSDCETYGDGEFHRRFESLRLCLIDETIKDFVFDLRAVIQLAEVLPGTDFMRSRARNALEKVFGMLSQYPARMTVDDIRTSAADCDVFLREVLDITGGDGTHGRVGIIGHSHMDTAWLWSVAETIRKCARTYSTALELMEEYPEYKFVQSSALHLDWMREYYPDIFEGIKKQTAAGRYEPNGGVWVECDCNITSGESMVRQFLRGQLFTRKYLDYTSDCFWLPDTFGYNGAIPQIMLGCEVKYFYTTKIACNDLNTFPYDTFIWGGIDGSEVLTHFNRIHIHPDIATAFYSVNDIKDKQVNESRLLSFGFGDGGGGPTWGMLEDARRVRGLAGVPEMYYTTVSGFMQDIEENAVNLPLYNGELYFELHRGTLTQMHDIKKNNRRAEYALRDMEYFDVLRRKPKSERSDRLYATLLKNQFHDILPGTSLTSVNELAREQVTELISEARSAVAESIMEISSPVEDSITLYNTLSFDRSDISSLPGRFNAEGAVCQSYTDINGEDVTLIGGVTLPAFGSVTLKKLPASDKVNAESFEYDGKSVKTPCLCAKFDEDGCISSLRVNGACGEIRRDGGAPLNTFYLGEDIPQMYDDWDIDSDQDLKMRPSGKLLSRAVATNGELCFILRSEYALTDETKLRQDMIFYADTPRIDFRTVIDWNEKQKLLKVGFDVDILSQTMKNEIQFGHIDRPTTRNTSTEVSRFEVCNHKWTDLSESRRGVALLNDCKYGISVEGSDMRLSLHRGGIRPDVTGDRGVHEFVYSLLPHEGGFSVPAVVLPAYMLNIPAVAASGAPRSAFEPPVVLSENNIICEAVKPAELRRNAYVVRLFEAERTRTACRVSFPHDVKRVYLTNMLEDIKEELRLDGGAVTLDFAPFKIITLMAEYED